MRKRYWKGRDINFYFFDEFKHQTKEQAQKMTKNTIIGLIIAALAWVFIIGINIIQQ